MRRRFALFSVVALTLVTTVALLPGCSRGAETGASGDSVTPEFTPGAGGVSGTVRQGQAIGYFASGEKLVPVRLDARADDPAGTLAALFAGPTSEAKEASCTSAIPPGSKALGVTIDGDTATADVSPEFGSTGGSLSMQFRVAQVVFTLTRDPAVKKVVITMEGTPMKNLGGEGLSLLDPQTRADWEQFSPQVLIESPVLGDFVQSPLTVTGSAKVPVPRFKLAVTGADGFQVVSAATTPTADVGTRGDFERTLEFELPPGEGAVVAWYAVPGSGVRVVAMEVPVLVK